MVTFGYVLHLSTFFKNLGAKMTEVAGGITHHPLTINDPPRRLPTSDPMSGRKKSPWESAKHLALGRDKRASNQNARARCALDLVKTVITTPKPSKRMRSRKKEKGSSSKVRTSRATVAYSRVYVRWWGDSLRRRVIPTP